MTMAVFRLFITTIFFLLITSIVRTYSIPYEDIHLTFINPRLIYTSSEYNPTFSGYSYMTRDFYGGESNVVFTIGPDSVNRLKNEINSIYKANTMKMSEKYSQKDIVDETEDNLISSEQQSKSEKIVASMNKIEDVLNVNVPIEKTRTSENSELINKFSKHQISPQKTSFVHMPYPAFRSNLMNLHFPVVTRYYALPNLEQSQYYSHNLYNQLGLPLHNFHFYNPIVPLIYQASTTAPISFKNESTAVKDTKEFVEPYIAKKLQINATASESSFTTSRLMETTLDVTSMANVLETTSSTTSSVSLDKTNSTNKPEMVKKITTSGSIKSTVKSEDSNEEIIENKINKLINTEVNTFIEASSTISTTSTINM